VVSIQQTFPVQSALLAAFLFIRNPTNSPVQVCGFLDVARTLASRTEII